MDQFKIIRSTLPDNRGLYLRWDIAGKLDGQIMWSSDYQPVSDTDSDAAALHNAAAGMIAALEAAGIKINHAIGEYAASRHTLHFERAVNEHVVPAWRRLRSVAIHSKITHEAALKALASPIVRPNMTAHEAAASAARDAEIRDVVDSFPSHTAAYEWVMGSEGIDVLNAVAPWLHLTRFATLPDDAMRSEILQEFKVRKVGLEIANNRDDSQSSVHDPLRVTMDADKVRMLAKGLLHGRDIRGQAVESAARMLSDVAGFVHRVLGKDSVSDAFDFLIGRPLRNG